MISIILLNSYEDHEILSDIIYGKVANETYCRNVLMSSAPQNVRVPANVYPLTPALPVGRVSQPIK